MHVKATPRYKVDKYAKFSVFGHALYYLKVIHQDCWLIVLVARFKVGMGGYCNIE